MASEQQCKYCEYLSAFYATFLSRLFCFVTTFPHVFMGLCRHHRKMWSFIVFHFDLVSLDSWGWLFLICVPSQPPAQPQPTHLWGNGEEVRDKKRERALLLQEHFSAIANTLVCDPQWFSHRCKAQGPTGCWKNINSIPVRHNTVSFLLNSLDMKSLTVCLKGSDASSSLLQPASGFSYSLCHQM